MTTTMKKKPQKKHSTKKPKAPTFEGWRTSDQDEIERRRHRGATESFTMEARTTTTHSFYGNYLVRSESRSSYEVEIRSLQEPINTCDCPDHAVNQLGTCKHIEAVLHKLSKRRKRHFQIAANENSPLVEVFVDRRDDQVHILWPLRSRPGSKIRKLLEPYFSADNTLLNEATSSIPALRRKVNDAPKLIRDKLRMSAQIEPWLVRRLAQEQKQKQRIAFEIDVATGKRSLDVVNVPLYSYQEEGMKHLAFTERALLADEMGLGKTVQAIAACELLRRSKNIERVLVIAPASLKAEWEEQINKFTNLSSLIIQGSRANRLKQYRQPAFFYLANYEQVLFDLDDIQQQLAPDVIILDEAQRIKNWQTKTANAVKQLKSRYAFVLTGTPLENRIDEIYSIIQFLDPHVFGSLFRFNRDFYQLDEKGQAAGYKNLDQLHRRLRPVMLRRLKNEVEGNLPGRTDKNYFVAMTAEQELRYNEYNSRVARLMAMAKRRPLRKEEWDKLQKWLACMRMLCDTPYILDSECTDSPKLEELEKIFDDLLVNKDNKIIIFSEWTRMLELICKLADQKGIGYALHTGAIPQPKRRLEINRFKNSADCRLFLSSDAGSTGLNLQNANIVINMDLPWNPAKLEQRIARAWRKHQTRPVQVINLICEHSIEHRMLHLLNEKKSLAYEVVDGLGEKTSMDLPSGRAAFMERMESLMGEPGIAHKVTMPEEKQEISPIQQLHDDSVSRWGARLDLLQVCNQNNRKTVVAVVDHCDSSLNSDLEKNVAENLPQHDLEILDRSTYETIQRLIEAGVLNLNSELQTLHQSQPQDKKQQDKQKQQLNKARKHLNHAERKINMATVLANGGFVIEAIPALGEAVEGSLESLALLDDIDNTPLSILYIESHLIGTKKVPENTTTLVAQLRENKESMEEQQALTLLKDGQTLLQHVTETLNQMALR